MHYFHNDYNEMCYPEILKVMEQTASIPMDGYGEDVYCEQAAAKIRKLCGREDIAVHFLVGGTQTNLTVISAALRPHQAVLSADGGHIHVHETGAIEATGHKVIPLTSCCGKISSAQILDAVDAHWKDTSHEHMPQPKMVYISQPTELGTVYSLDELRAISEACKEKDLYLFIDGARLGYALSAQENDATLSDIAQLADVFYIGGTKVGAMFGEAVVISNPNLKTDFRYLMKRHGGMLAKGWLLGLQFKVLMEEERYLTIAKHANILADKIRDTLIEKGYPMPVVSGTNQVFAELPESVCQSLDGEFTYCPWSLPKDGHMLVRFCTSWATKSESVDALCQALRNL